MADPNQLSRHERRLVDQIHAERLEELADRTDRLSRNAGLAHLAGLATDLDRCGGERLAGDLR